MSKTCKKATLFTVILTVILAAALVVGILFGFNKGAQVDDNKTLTISMEQIVYETEMFDDVKEECEKAFGGAKYSYQMKGEMDGYESELVYVFDKDVDVEAISAALNARFDELTAEGGAWYGYDIDAMSNTQTTVKFVVDGYALRAIIAGVVFAVLALAYVWIRFKWNNGIVAMLCTVFSMALTAAVIILVRIPVTASVVYAIMLSAFFAVTAVLLNLNKLSAASKSEGAANKSAEELVSSTVAKKSVLGICATAAIAILLVGALSGTANLWFAVSSVIGMAIAAFLGVVYAPAVCAALMPVAAAKVAEKDKFAYRGAKKTSSKVKKAPVAETSCDGCGKACETKEEVAEEPVTEETEESVTEETEETEKTEDRAE